MIFAVSGDFQTETLLASLEERLADWPTAESAREAETTIPWPPEGPSFDPTPGLYHYEADTSQAKVALGEARKRRIVHKYDLDRNGRPNDYGDDDDEDDDW